MVTIPNRQEVPLTTEERLADRYFKEPQRLIEFARETGNR